jgi:hypothetical protein
VPVLLLLLQLLSPRFVFFVLHGLWPPSLHYQPPGEVLVPVSVLVLVLPLL